MHTLATDEFDTPDQVKQDLQTQLDELTEKTDEKLSALIDAMSLTDELIIKAAWTKINKN